MKYSLTFLCCLFTFLAHTQTLQSIESVEYDPTENRFLVSNSSSIIARNSDESLDYFGDGAASAGMEVVGNTLFAISGSSIYGYDLTTEEEVMSITIPGVSFLNGMTNDGSQHLYVTDFSSHKIHKINISDLLNPSSEIIVEDTESTPNGIIYDESNNRLIFVTWGSNAAIKAVDLTDNSMSVLTTTVYDNIDGIDENNEGDYYISYWSSGTKISKYDANFENPPVTITVSGLSNPADICYAKPIDTLAIPHSGNQLTFIDFNTISALQNETLDEQLSLVAFPNPVQENTVISFYLEAAKTVDLAIYDQQGKFLHNLMKGKQIQGKHHVLFNKLDLPTGIYFARLQVGEKEQVVTLVSNKT